MLKTKAKVNTVDSIYLFRFLTSSKEVVLKVAESNQWFVADER